MNKIIRLVTTKGCEGCRIAENILRKAIEQSGISGIQVEIIDCQNISYTTFIKRYFINDFPTMVFIKNNNVLTKIVGTIPVCQIVNLLKELYN